MFAVIFQFFFHFEFFGKKLPKNGGVILTTKKPAFLSQKITNQHNAFDWERYIEYRKSAVRCKVEHAFKIIKDTFGFRKVRYKGIAKNLNKLNVLFACANLLMVKRVQNDFRPVKG